MIESPFLKFKEILTLLWINLKVKVRNFAEFVRIVQRFYPRFRFAKIDSALLLSYLFANPFDLSKRFLIQKGEKDIYTYGETPLTTLEYIVGKCSLSPSDVVFELGCGRGRTCFWLNEFIGCRVVGIDHVPAFIEKANNIKKRFQVKNVSFRLENLFRSNLNGASAIYLYGTCLTAGEIRALIQRFSKLPAGTKVITVSYALAEIQPGAPFEILEKFQALFTWGVADVYLQKKTTARRGM